MSAENEIEVKFLVKEIETLRRSLLSCGFRERTPRTHEMNTLYDTPGRDLRSRGELLRIRNYRDQCTLTHKSKGTTARHKSRQEIETAVANGNNLDAIFRALGYTPSFRYEKFRAEWTDGKGHVVIDETPIGNFAEIEGSPDWIDRVASSLGISEDDYITKNYAALFFEWKERTHSKADEMTWESTGAPQPLS